MIFRTWPVKVTTGSDSVDTGDWIMVGNAVGRAMVRDAKAGHWTHHNGILPPGMIGILCLFGWLRWLDQGGRC